MNRWSAIETANLTGDDAQEQEVIQNTSLRLLSKDYIDMMQKLLEVKTSGSPSSQNGADVEDAVMAGGDSEAVPGQTSQTSEEPGDCGELILSDPSCFQYTIHLCIQYELQILNSV